MSYLRKSKFSRVAASLVGFTMALSMMFAGALPAQAQTAAELQAQIAGLLATIQALQSQLSALQGGGSGSVACSFTFTQSLTVGATGQEVKNLQIFLNMDAATQVAVSGAGSPGNETMYFGPATKAAVIKFQNKYAAEVLAPVGLAAGTGYWGPSSRAKANAICAGQVPPVVVNPGTGTPTTGVPALSGVAGTLADVIELSAYNNEEVGAGQSGVKVLGVDLKASNEGDIALRSIKVNFDPTTTASTASKRLSRYITGVDIWMGSTKVGSADVADFYKDSSDVYTANVVVSYPVIKAGATERFYVTIDTPSIIDSADLTGEAWQIDLDNIRYIDGAGVTTTDSRTGALPSLDVPINFVTFSSAADTKVKVTTATSNPVAGVVIVDADNETENVVLLRGSLELEGTSDVVIDEFPVTLTGTASTSLAAIANTLKLQIGGTEFSKTVSTTTASVASTTFNNMNYAVSAGQTVDFVVLADVNDINPTGASSTDFNEGYTLLAEVTASNMNSMDVENELGDQVADADKTGTALGNTQTFRTEGVTVSAVSTSATSYPQSTASSSYATYKVVFDVTAWGDSAYIENSIGTSTQGVVYDIEGSTFTGTATPILSSTASLSGSYYLVQEGQTKQFTMTVTLDPSAAGSFGIDLDAINFNDTAASYDATYTADNNNASLQTDTIYILN